MEKGCCLIYISDNFIQVRITNNTIYNETYYYANDKLVAKKDKDTISLNIN